MSESIFTSQTPSTSDANDGVGYTLCTLFTPAADGTVTGIRVWVASTPPASMIGGLFQRTSDAGGVELGRATFGALTGGAWNTVSLSSPVSVTAGTYYYAAYYTPSHYVATGGLFTAAGVTSGNLTAPADDTVTPRRNGRFVTPVADLTYPNNQAGGGCYFADVLFSAAGTDATVTPATVAGIGAVAAAAVSTSSSVSPATVAGTGAVNAAVITVPAITVGLGSAGWYKLLAINKENAAERTYQQQRQPSACPNDGEPLLGGRDGVLFCPFDGWRWDGIEPH